VIQLPLSYFDDQGNKVTSATAPGAVYQVNVVVNTQVVLTGGSSSTPANLASLIIEIVSNPANQTLTYNPSTKSVVQDPTHGIYVSRYSAFVANNSNNN